MSLSEYYDDFKFLDMATLYRQRHLYMIRRTIIEIALRTTPSN